jgi:hypothetical protein
MLKASKEMNFMEAVHLRDQWDNLKKKLEMEDN